MRFISAEETDRILDWDSAINCIRDAYGVTPEQGNIPGRVIARATPAFIRCMPAIPPFRRYMGTKQIVRGLQDHVRYLITLFDQQTASLEYIIDAMMITAKRTAATSAAAVDRLAGEGPLRLGVLGSGLEARSHVEAISRVRKIEALTVYSPNAANRTRFAADFEASLGIPASAAASAQEAVEGASCIVAAARSRGEKPILFGASLKPGVLVVSIGSTIPSQRELDVSVIDRADIIVADEPRELVEETGDMLEAARQGIAFDHKIYSLRDLMGGAIENLDSRSEKVLLFKSLGSALQDITVAEFIAERATAQGMGTPLRVGIEDKVTQKKNG